MSVATPEQAEAVIDAYFRAWNACDTDRIAKITANPVIRHYAGKTVQMTHAEQIARIKARHAKDAPDFQPVIRHSDGTYVTAIWNNTYASGKQTCGSETFKVVDGIITDVWNPLSIDEGNWAESGTDETFEIPDGFVSPKA